MKAISVFAALIMCAALQAIEPVLEFRQDCTNTGTSSASVKCGTVINGGRLSEGIGRIDGKSVLFGNPARGNERGSYAGMLVPCGKAGMDFSKPFSVTAFVKLSEDILNNGPQYTVAGTSMSDNGPGWRLLYSWGSFRFHAGKGQKGQPGDITTLSVPTSNFTVDSSCWNHLAVTYDGKSARLFLNGELTAESEMTIHKGADDISVGCYGHGYAYGLRGSLSELKFFGEALSAEQILADMLGE